MPYTAGGTTDLVARTAGQKVAEKLGQPVIVENRPGAGGNIGMDAVAKAAPDGYTIGFGAISTNALNPFVYPSMPFDPTKDFTGISMLGASSVVLETGPSIKVDSVRIWSPMPSSIRAPRSARRERARRCIWRA